MSGTDQALLQGGTSNRASARNPAIPVVCALSAGILLDRWLSIPWSVWLIAGAICAVAWLVACRRPVAATVLLLACCIAVGGARHHALWSGGGPSDISLFATAEPQLVTLTGRVAAAPTILSRDEQGAWSAYPQVDLSMCPVECLSLAAESGDVDVSGRLRLTVAGHLLHVSVGDTITAVGWLSLARGPANPGAFDFRDFLRRQQERAVMHADAPDAVTRVAQHLSATPRRFLARMRTGSEQLISAYLSPRSLPLANALLLGDRSLFDMHLRTAFTDSGTMHLLAISGLHVAILASFCWIGCRLLNLTPGVSLLVVALGVTTYVVLIDIYPSVVRSLVMLAVAGVGIATHRRLSAANSLAIAALVLLLWNPTSLFDVGAQLSFLAVLGILAGMALVRRWERRSQTGLAALVAQSRQLPAWLDGLWGWWKETCIVMGTIWILTAPLVAARFQVVSPVGLLVNIVLVPYVTLVLLFGYVFLFCAWLAPPLAVVFGFLFDWSLRLFLASVEWAAATRWGHVYASGPPDWWLAGYYLLIAVLLLAAVHIRWKRLAALALSIWVVGGLAVSLWPERQAGLQCTFLSVGHGCSVAVRFPSGRLLIYDAGNLQDGHRAERIVRQALWQTGAGQIDALIVSHCDVDHYNGVPGLLRSVPVGTLLVSQPFLDFEQQGVEAVCDTAVANRVPVRLVCAGDRLQLDETASVEVLHPTWGPASDDDNANSIVLGISYAGRTVLLTGDLEAAGLEQLLARSSQDVDILLAPHHGSLGANTPALAEWASPEVVVVSSGQRVALDKLQSVYGDQTQVIATATAGAVTCAISPDGELRVESFYEE